MMNRLFLALLVSMVVCVGCSTNKTVVKLHPNESSVTVVQRDQLVILPIEETAAETTVNIYAGEDLIYPLDIRLAVNKIDYYLPLDLKPFVKNTNKFIIELSGISKDAVFWETIASGDYDETNREYYRPVYHHTPKYGWMNDANGLVYKDGIYHLFYQYNPYACVWGNMHWGHSTSEDLIHWTSQPIALYRDTVGHIFSGSSIVDKANDAGFGEGAIISFYTSHIWIDGEQVQRQCMAYSTDNGKSFTKYNDGQPILYPADGIRNFRDPKVFRYAPEDKWVMIVSADTQMRFFQSKDLKNWEYMSAWGDGYGAQPCQFECPDMFEVALESEPDIKKWVLIVNVNPGCYFGGSATQYFVGEFDGTSFVCDSPKETVKWLDWGKDHYATVCFSNISDRIIAVPWMSNWQYGAIVPTTQYRSSNALPRELGLFKKGSEYYVSSYPVKEMELLRKDSIVIEDFPVTEDKTVSAEVLVKSEGAFEVAFDLQSGGTELTGFKLKNEKGELVDIYLDFKLDRVVMDRVNSGIVSFGENSTTHEIESHERRKEISMNYHNDFALATWAPISQETTYKIRVMVDKYSIELFVDGGQVAMTNLVFPTDPYSFIEFYANRGTPLVKNLTIYQLK